MSQPPLGGYGNIALGVDPADSKTFCYGLRGLYRSTDGGASGIRDNQNPTVNGTPVPCPPQQDNRVDNRKAHADHHALAFSPPGHRAGNVAATLYLGSDGGLVSTSDRAETFTYLNGGLATVLMTGFDAGRDGESANGGFSYGTAQDNGIFARTPDQPALEWRQGPDSDGSAAVVDPRDSRHALATPGAIFATRDGRAWAGAGTGLAGHHRQPQWRRLQPPRPSGLLGGSPCPTGREAHALHRLLRSFRSMKDSRSRSSSAPVM